MFHSILVPLDGSTFSEHALPMALSVARRLGASVEVVHVHSPLQVEHRAFRSPQHDALNEAVRQRGREYLDTVVERLTAMGDVRLEAKLLEGPIAETIARHADEARLDLIVMTSRGPGPLGRVWLGSVADGLIRQSGKPILLVPPQAEPPDLLREITLRQILIPLDGSHCSEQIVLPAIALGGNADSRFTLLRVVPPLLPSYPPGNLHLSGEVLDQLQALHRQEEEEMRSDLERIADQMRQRSMIVDTRLVTQEQPAAGILQVASELQADLIAMTTQGRSGLGRLFLGSVAARVLRDAVTPVLAYRPVIP